MMNRLILPVFTIIILFASCHTQWKDPNKTLPSAEAEIISILVNPSVYDSAGVKVTGMVWDKERIEPEPKENEDGELVKPDPYIYFKLSDHKGYYVGVVVDERHSSLFDDGDIVEVVGLFRRDYVSDSRHFKNEIDAKQLKVVESLKEKYEN